MAHQYSAGDRVEVSFTDSSSILKEKFGLPDDGSAKVDITKASREKTYPSGASDPLYDGTAVNYPVTIDDFSEEAIIRMAS
jgi:hypothetical protein